MIPPGTWIPLGDGRDLALKNGVLDKLLPMFDFVPGDRSPPPAPKHATAASRPRAPRAQAQPRRQPAAYTAANPDYEAMDVTMHGEDTPDNTTVISESPYDDYDHSNTMGSRKRRRVDEAANQADTEHRLWAEELLDYFILQDDPPHAMPEAPVPPNGANLDRPIDDKGHTALSWAAAMGDVEVVKDLVRRGAGIDVPDNNGDTPLMRTVAFTNCFDRQNMDRIAGLLIRTVHLQEFNGRTVFHQIANTTKRKSKYQCARYYMDSILNKMHEMLDPDSVESIINTQDLNGDTAVTIAARHGARKCVRSLIGRNARVDIPNVVGETADQLIVQLNHRRQERARQCSSSPFGTGDHAPGAPTSTIAAHTSHTANGMPFDLERPTSSPAVYKSEAALQLTTQIMPVVVAKAKSLATQLDAELEEKEADLAEAQRVVELRRGEIDSLRRQAEDMRARDADVLDAVDDEMRLELEQLENECRAITKAEEDRALRALVAAERTRAATATTTTTGDANDEDNADDSPQARLLLARQMLEVNRRRRQLLGELVQGLASAGVAMGNQQQYKRLIRGALGVREEDVESLLPEIVAELEEGRMMEGGGAGAAGDV